MKKFKGLLMLFMLCAVVMLVPNVKAEAATKTLQNGKTYTVNTTTIYKFKVPEEGYIIITVKNANGELVLERKEGSVSVKQFDSKSKEVNMEALKKGTYELYINKLYGKGTINIKFVKYKKTYTNTTVAKAKTIKQNSKQTVVMQKSHIQTLIYKLTLKTNERIRIEYEGNCQNMIYLANSNGGNVLLNGKYINSKDDILYDKKKKVTYLESEQILKKGTYYIYIQSSSFYGMVSNSCAIKFKWNIAE